MRRAICKQADTQPGTTTITLEPDDATLVVIRAVPAETCPNCGEAYTDEATTQRLLDIVQEARRGGVQVDVRHDVAA